MKHDKRPKALVESKTVLTLIPAFALGLACTASAQSFNTDFGSLNDGLDGFTQSTTDGAWTTNPDNIQLVYDTNDNASFQNAGLLKDFGFFFPTPGTIITMTGSVTWSSYADDNNRIGMYAFGEFSDMNQNGDGEVGALSFLWHAEDGLHISTGIQATNLSGFQALSGTTPFTPGSGPANTITDYALDFEVVMEYVAGTTDLDLEFSMTYEDASLNSVTDTVSTTVNSFDYFGNNFGFAGRARDRGDVPNRTGTFDARYENFSLEIVPEPSSFALLSGVLALGWVTVRRRQA
jgi:hypothetical protein